MICIHYSKFTPYNKKYNKLEVGLNSVNEANTQQRNQSKQKDNFKNIREKERERERDNAKFRDKWGAKESICELEVICNLETGLEHYNFIFQILYIYNSFAS